jgi:hypothetical protein
VSPLSSQDRFPRRLASEWTRWFYASAAPPPCAVDVCPGTGRYAASTTRLPSTAINGHIAVPPRRIVAGSPHRRCDIGQIGLLQTCVATSASPALCPSAHGSLCSRQTKPRLDSTSHADRGVPVAPSLHSSHKCTTALITPRARGQ